MSSSGAYEWKVGGELPLIAKHSLAKHRVIREYIKRYVAHLTANPRNPALRLTIVDGFAGGGRYRDENGVEHPGSPLIMLNAIEEAQLACAEARTNPFCLDAEFHFIESNPGAQVHLDYVLKSAGHGRQLGRTIQLHHGLFEEKYRAILEWIRAHKGAKHRAVFVLDQYGYTDVPFPVIREILASLENAEIILTFATDCLINYLTDTVEVRARLHRMGLQVPLEKMLALKGLTGDRQKIQFLLHQDMVRATGAKFFTPFFIRSEEANRDYWLVHLSSHHRARDVMTALHWEESNYFAHYGHEGLKMLGYRPSRELPQTGFFFDDQAAKHTRDALMDELPHEIWTREEGLSVDDLYREIANEVPASTVQLIDALEALHAEGDVEIRGSGGGVKRGGSTRLTDRILPVRQLAFSGPGFKQR